jgi:hypothetical protein
MVNRTCTAGGKKMLAQRFINSVVNINEIKQIQQDSSLCGMKENYYIIDTIDRYNKWYSKETLHPLVTVLNHNTVPDWMNGATLRYGVYGLFLKQGDGCSIRYGRESYDYQEGTVVSFAPGQTATPKKTDFLRWHILPKKRASAPAILAI